LLILYTNLRLLLLTYDACINGQADAFTVDMRASLELYHKTAVERREELLDAEAAWLYAAGVHVVVSDTVPLACAAAHAAQLPCAVVTNFSWGECRTFAYWLPALYISPPSDMHNKMPHWHLEHEQ
jgi:hypothetical protein